MLMQLYQYADIAYVGGGFARAGVHNVLEPAAHGKPVIIGPEFSAYGEAVELVSCGGAVVSRNGEELAVQIRRWKDDEASRKAAGAAARKMVENSAGATERILAAIEKNFMFGNTR